jgi:hypothetical protein
MLFVFTFNQVRWEESGAGERPNRVSIWEIESVATPFFICPPFFRLKRPVQPGLFGKVFPAL